MLRVLIKNLNLDAHHKRWLQAISWAVMPEQPTRIRGLVNVYFFSADYLHALQEECEREGTPSYLALNRALCLGDPYLFQHTSQNLVANIFANKLNSQQSLSFFFPKIHPEILTYEVLTSYLDFSPISLKPGGYTLI